MFCDHALRRLRATALASSEQERAGSKTLLALLLAVATAHTNDPAYAEITAAARSAMNSTLGIMSAPDFVAGILTILQSSSPTVRPVSCRYLTRTQPDTDTVHRFKQARWSCWANA